MKNTIKLFISSVFVLVVFLFNGLNAFAVSTDFSVSEISEEEKSKIIDNLDITLISEEPSQKTIECFDVSNEELIALGHRNSSNTRSVSVYDSIGNFKYGYKFNYNAAFGVEWKDGYLNIYLVRSDVLVVVDCDANVIDIVSVQNTKENNDYINNYIFGTEKTVGNIKYSLQNRGILKIASSSYSQLVKTHPTGEEIVLYDVSSIATVKAVFIMIGIAAFVSLTLYVLVKKIRK